MTQDVLVFVGAIVISTIVTGISVATAMRGASSGTDHMVRKASADTYASMESTMSSMSKRLTELENLRDNDHAAMTAMAERIRILENYVDILIRQLRDAGIEPEGNPGDTIMVATPVNRVTFEAKLKKSFSLEELDELAERVGIDPSDLPGGSLPRRIHELVALAERQNLMSVLILAAREMRPRMKW